MTTIVNIKKESTGEIDKVYLAPLSVNEDDEYYYNLDDLSTVDFATSDVSLHLEPGSLWALKFFTFGLPGSQIVLTLTNTSQEKGSGTIPEDDNKTVGWLYFKVK